LKHIQTYLYHAEVTLVPLSHAIKSFQELELMSHTIYVMTEVKISLC